MDTGAGSGRPSEGRVPPSRTLADRVARRRLAALAGHARDAPTARSYLDDADPGVRATALQALGRCEALDVDVLTTAAGDPSPVVRRRAAELLATSTVAVSLLALLDDADPSVVEVAAFAAGERHEEGRILPETDAPERIVDRLSALARDHDDPLVREAAVAALGSIGLPSGRNAVLAALDDKVTIRRRAVIALAAFEGDDVEAALHRALEDRDWHVRQTAEDLLA